MNPLSKMPLSQSHISNSINLLSSSSVSYQDLDLAFAHLLFNSKQFKTNMKDFSLAIQSNMKYPLRTYSAIKLESAKLIGKKREHECFDKALNESSSKDQVILSKNIQSDLKLIDDIKILLLRSDHKYMEEHSKCEIVLKFTIFQLSYSITIDRNKQSISQLKKDNIYLNQDSSSSSVNYMFNFELEDIIKKLQKLI